MKSIAFTTPASFASRTSSLRLGRVHRQRLLGDDVLLRGQDFLVDREVQMIRRAVVHDLNLRIGQQLLVVAVRLGDRQLLGLGLGEVVAALGDGRDLDEAEPPNRLDVCGADETGADDACFDFGHVESVVDCR